MPTTTAPPPVATPPEGTARPKLTGRQIATRTLLISVLLAIVAMWIYAFAFADDRPLAQLDDKQWPVRAQEICRARDVLLDANAEESAATGDGTPQSIAGPVDRATDIVEDALDTILEVRPTSERDVRLVNEWESLYRTYIADRRSVAVRLAAGEATELNETKIGSSPISLTIADFAKHNRMPACAVPANR